MRLWILWIVRRRFDERDPQVNSIALGTWRQIYVHYSLHCDRRQVIAGTDDAASPRQSGRKGKAIREMAGTTGLEPATSAVTALRE